MVQITAQEYRAVLSFFELRFAIVCEKFSVNSVIWRIAKNKFMKKTVTYNDDGCVDIVYEITKNLLRDYNAKQERPNHIFSFVPIDDLFNFMQCGRSSEWLEREIEGFEKDILPGSGN